MRIFKFVAIGLLSLTSFPSAFADKADKCAQPLSTNEFSLLLLKYQQASDQKQHTTWRLADRLSTEVLCSVFTPRYVPELKEVEKGTQSQDPLPYLKLAQQMQTRWENRYLLQVVANSKDQLAIANEGASALLLGSVSLAVFKEPKEVGLLFTLFRHLFPVVFPSVATATAKIWDKTGSVDGYPIAPAHIMTLVSVDAEKEKISPYDTWKTVVSGTSQLIGAQLAIYLISCLEIGNLAIGSVSLHPAVWIPAALSFTLTYISGKTVDEVEYIKLKNKVILAKETIICDVANGDDNETYNDSLAYYKAVLALSAYLDRSGMDAWNSYQKGLAEVKSSYHIPVYDESSAEHALKVYNKKLMKIEKSRDANLVQDVARFQVLNLLNSVVSTSEIPGLIAKLPQAEQEEATMIMNTAPDDATNGYKYYIEALMADQTHDLSKQFGDDDMPKDSDYILIESIGFLRSVNSPVLSDTIDNLTSAMNSKFLTSLSVIK